ncbi:hypothetical protein [Planktothrix mougeotii]|uniref:Uncharacterized protein n=1 Tax=Planktothrix mougeotii LEGE 06226 TaxID=1828728 RepID=A0ABR9UH08_9CYAN|nr:hypothetical protein [Planktothrix mougeotii]MBE9145752.1 hypothetical protein [Planktothrix mougeotii LEGE 06226]
MDVNAFQPVFDMLGLFKSRLIFLLIALGVFAAFDFKVFLGSLFMVAVFISLGYTLSPFYPGLMSYCYHYIIALGLGFLTGNIVKWVKSILWGY